MGNVNDAWPLQTSNDVHGDTATQGFNTAVEESLDPRLAVDAAGVFGQRNTGADFGYGSDADGEQERQQPDVLDRTTGDAKTMPNAVARRLETMTAEHNAVSYIRVQAPSQAGTFGFYWPAPNGSLGAVRVYQILTQDPNRYRVKLHTWVPTGSTGQVWIGSDPGNVQQAASGNLSLSAYPLPGGNVNATNETEFYWGDDMWAALDVGATVDTYVFVTVERYR